MKDLLNKYLTKTYFVHLLTRTEDGFIFDKVTLFIFLKGVCKEISAVKHNHKKDSMMKYLNKHMFYHLVTGN